MSFAEAPLRNLQLRARIDSASGVFSVSRQVRRTEPRLLRRGFFVERIFSALRTVVPVPTLSREEPVMRTLLLSATTMMLLGLAYGASPASAAPVHPVQIAAPDSGIAQVRTTKRRKAVRSRTRRGTARATTGTTGGNVEQPSRAVPQSGKGGAGGAGGGGAQ